MFSKGSLFPVQPELCPHPPFTLTKYDNKAIATWPSGNLLEYGLQ